MGSILVVPFPGVAPAELERLGDMLGDALHRPVAIDPAAHLGQFFPTRLIRRIEERFSIRLQYIEQE